jgi:hypothetical protein
MPNSFVSENKDLSPPRIHKNDKLVDFNDEDDKKSKDSIEILKSIGNSMQSVNNLNATWKQDNRKSMDFSHFSNKNVNLGQANGSIQ